MVDEGIAFKGVEEETVSLIEVRGHEVEDDRYEGLDVEDRRRLSV